MLNKCLYQHRRQSDGEIFYVGIGKPTRPYDTKGRNKHWRHVAEKHGFYVEILQENLSNEDASKREIELIAKYRLEGKPLTNISDGGFLGPGLYGSDHYNYDGVYVLYNKDLKKFICKELVKDLVDLGFPGIYTKRMVESGKTFSSKHFHEYDKKIKFQIGRGDDFLSKLVSDGYSEIFPNTNICVEKKDFHTVRRKKGNPNGNPHNLKTPPPGYRNPCFTGFYVGHSLSGVVVFDGEKSMRDAKFNSNSIRDCVNSKRANNYRGFEWFRTLEKSRLRAILADDFFYDSRSKELLASYFDTHS